MTTATYQQQYTTVEHEKAFDRLVERLDKEATRAPGSWRSKEAAECRLLCWRVLAVLHSEQRREQA